MKGIEIPFGAKDSELCGWEYTIPEGMEAVVENGKVIVRRKESEDERIRKELIALVVWAQTFSASAITKEEANAMKAYLERRKEQPMSAEEVFIRAGLKPYRDGNQWCVLAGGNIQEGICGFGDTIDEALYQFLMEVLKIQEEQKPKQEWSEEDKKMRNSIIEAIHNLWPYEHRDKCINWLKSLRPSWKPSEQEKAALRTAICVLTEERNFPKTAGHLQAILDAFEGKESRKGWKPSEEQMQYLLAVINDPNNIGAESCYMTIKSLYNDLKKL